MSRKLEKKIAEDHLKEVNPSHGSPRSATLISVPLALTRPSRAHAKYPRYDPHRCAPSHPSGSNNSLSASTSTLRATSSSSRTPRPQSGSRRSTPDDSPTSGAARRLPPLAQCKHGRKLGLARVRRQVAPYTSGVPRFRTIPVCRMRWASRRRLCP